MKRVTFKIKQVKDSGISGLGAEQWRAGTEAELGTSGKQPGGKTEVDSETSARWLEGGTEAELET